MIGTSSRDMKLMTRRNHPTSEIQELYLTRHKGGSLLGGIYPSRGGAGIYARGKLQSTPALAAEVNGKK